MKRHSSKKSREREGFSLLIWALLLGAIPICLFASIFIFREVRTFAFMTNIFVSDERFRLLRYITPEPDVREEAVSVGNGKTFHVLVMEPPSYDTLFVMYAPWAKQASQNAELRGLAEAFTRMGFFVVAYTREPEAGIALPTEQTNEEIKNLVRHYANDPGKDFKHIGYFGISIGNGPIFAAAGSPDLRDRSKFIIAFSTFFDHRTQQDFLKNGRASYKDISLQMTPSPGYVRELTEYVQSIGFRDLDAFFESDFYKSAGSAIALMNLIDDIHVPVYIMHTKADDVSPYVNALQLADALKPHTEVKLFLSDMIKHGSVRALNWKNFKKYYLPEGLSFYGFMRGFLHDQADGI